MDRINNALAAKVMPMNKNFYDLVYLTSKTINGEKEFELPERANWEAIYALSREQMLDNLLGYALGERTRELPESVAAKLTGDSEEKDLYFAIRENEVENILKALEANKIRVLPLKGWIIRDLYPEKNMRSMTDIDIFVDKAYYSKVQEIMIKNGFKLDHYGINDDLYTKRPNIHIEIHRALMPDTKKLYNMYYRDFWGKTLSEGGSEYIRRMSDEDFYIYHITHMAKHVQIGGLGIRNFADAWLMLKNYGDSIDSDYIATELQKLNLVTFEKYVRHTAQMWFDEKADYPRHDEVTETFDDFVMEGSLFGSVQESQKSRIAKEGRFKYFLRLMFPAPSKLRMKYKILFDHPVLYPVLYVVRWFDILIFDRDKIKKESTAVEMSNDEINDRRNFFREIGL